MGTDYLSMYGYNVNFKTVEEVADTMTDVILELEGAWGQIKSVIEKEDLGLSDKKRENFINFAEDMRVRCGAALTRVNDISSLDTLEENQMSLRNLLHHLQESEDRFTDIWKKYNVDNIKNGTDEVIHILSDVEGFRFCLEELAYIKLDEEEY